MTRPAPIFVHRLGTNAQFPIQGRAGLTLWSVSIAICVAGIVSVLAFPMAKQALIDQRAATVTTDLRRFADALHAYAQKKGDWPPGGTEPGVLPSGLEQALQETDWSRGTPIGGQYTWSPNSLHRGERFHAVIALISTVRTQVSADPRQLLAIDRLVDDGNLGTGRFRLGYRNFPIFVVEP